VKSTRITIVPNDQVKQPEVPTVKDLQNAVTSTINQAGDIPNGLAQPSKASSEGENGTGKKEHDEVDFHPSSTDAQFPGGAEGFKKFMTRYLVTPDELEIGERKTVLVRFEVDVDGSISNTEIMQTGGDRFDKEVLRVLSKMPKWIPATQNGVKVATWFTQPVTFIGVEQ
jgi:protein TonB